MTNIHDEVKKSWDNLNEWGIFTKEQLDKEIRENQLDIGLFTMPYKKKGNV